MQPQAGPPPDSSRRLLNLSGAALLWSIAGVIVLCVIGPIAMCLLCGMDGLLGGVGDPYPTPTAYP